MTPFLDGVTGLLAELKRRKVYRIAAVYAATGFLVVQAADLMFPRVGLPDWTVTLVVWLVLLGFPLAVILAWAFEVTPEGVRRTPPAGRQEGDAGRHGEGPAGASARPSTRPFHVALEAVGALAIVGAVVAGTLYLQGDRPGAGRNGGTEGEAAGETAPAAGGGAADGDGASAETPPSGPEAATGAVSFDSEPAGVEVVLTRVDPPGGFADRAPAASGTTPFTADLPAGEYHARLGAPRANELDLLVHVPQGDTARVEPALVTAGDLTEGMVRVSAGPSPLSDERLEAYLADRTEVTNEAYQAFVSDDGYEDPAWWPDTLILGDRPLPWKEARGKLVDSTGLPGPRGWSGGIYPTGTGDHPVAGITRYEAEAYCRWAGKELPAWDRWWRAAVAGESGRFPWGRAARGLEHRANFGLEGTEPVGRHVLGASPFGALDMAGNVREWVRAEDRDGHVAVGGSWQDPPYMFEPDHAESFPPGFASETIGFRCVLELRRGR